MPTTYTPLRYPGGKSSLYPVASSILKNNSLENAVYIEPFAGGAGLALKLLLLNEVSSIVLNDLDPAIAAIWVTIFGDVEARRRFIDFINNVPLSISEWERRHDSYLTLRSKALSEYFSAKSAFTEKGSSPIAFLSEGEIDELACSAFYMNRTNRSGIMAGGPIGGKGQKGNYLLDARFNKTGLIEKIERIGKYADRVSVCNVDAFDFIREDIPAIESSSDEDVFVYFDPPYVCKGPGLYQNSLNENDHIEMARLIASCNAKWIVTYDECDFTRRLYGDYISRELSIGYCAYEIKRGHEILVLSDGLSLGDESLFSMIA